MLSLNEFLAKSNNRARIYHDFRAQADKELAAKLVICIPDMHLLEKGPNDDFLDRNLDHETRFEDFLYFLLDLKKSEGTGLEVIQLGDLYDLWQAQGSTNKIHQEYTNILNLLNDLAPVYVVGNHDIDLIRWYEELGETFGREWRYFSQVAENYRVIYEHGFQADFWNNQGQWSGAIGREITQIVNLWEYLDPDIDVELGGAWDAVRRIFKIYSAGLTPVHNPEFNEHDFFNYYQRLVEKYNRGETTDRHGPTDLALAVIGHTHRANLVKKPKTDNPNDFVYLMDCGSWVNGHHEFGVISGPEMAVCQWG